MYYIHNTFLLAVGPAANEKHIDNIHISHYPSAVTCVNQGHRYR